MWPEDLISGTITADGSMGAALQVYPDVPGKRVKLALDVQADIDKNSVNVTGGGLFGGILGELIELLYKIGVINVNTSYRDRSESVLFDLSSLQFRTPVARRRIGAGSMLCAIVEEG